MSNSNLVGYTRYAPSNHKTSPRKNKIDTITIHCTAGGKNNSAKSFCDYFATTDKKASCNYVVGGDGSIGLSVPEEDRSWCTSNADNDNRAVTIEVASDSKAPYEITDAALNSTIQLCADICKRNGIARLWWSTNKINRVNHLNGCNMTVHRDYASKACPGEYIYNRLGYIADEVNKLLTSEVSVMGNTTAVDEQKLTKIAGKSVIPKSVMVKVLENKDLEKYIELIGYFYEAGEVYGIRADLAICQSFLETGWFTFKGYVRPEWHNYAGLGATDKNANKNIAIFPNDFIGAVAQVQHLLAYANNEDPEKLCRDWKVVDPRFNLVTRGVAPYVEWLGQKENPKGKGWATGKDYGYKILKIYNDIYEQFKSEIERPSTNVEQFIKEVTEPSIEDLSKRRDTKDYVVQINPTKVNIFNDPKGKVVGILERSIQTIIEEQDGYGLLQNGKGWIQLCFTTFIKDAE